MERGRILKINYLYLYDLKSRFNSGISKNIPYTLSPYLWRDKSEV